MNKMPEKSECCGDKEKEQILLDFGRKLLSRMHSMPPKYQQLISDNFWMLLTDECHQPVNNTVNEERREDNDAGW